MINKIIDFCVKHRLFVFAATAVLMVIAVIVIANTPVDALPDLSDTQVIIYAKWDRPPQIIEDQVTYPIVTALLGAPKVRDIRAFSDYGYSYVYAIFDDGTDVYWARSRVLEYLSKVNSQLPEGVKVELGPDASGVGWVYEYALEDTSGKHSLADLRTFQDWHIKYTLQSVKGVSEVATVGGFVKQYQIVVNPDLLKFYNVTLAEVIARVKTANQEMGARLLDLSGKEYMVTVRGYFKSKADIESIVIREQSGAALTLGALASVELGPEIRRGIADKDGRGGLVGGIVIMRYGENALALIERVKAKIADLQLPEGVRLTPVYDRSELILRSIETLRKSLTEEMIVVALIIILFLFHLPSSAVPIITLPIAAAFAFIPMYFLGLSSNIMSLGGIAIAIGAMVDASIVCVENTHTRLSGWIKGGRRGDYRVTVVDSLKEVGRSAFFSLLVIAVSFIPIFTLEGIEGRLFRPLAFTKNFAMFFGAVLAVTLVPALIMTFIRAKRIPLKQKWLDTVVNKVIVGEIHEEEKHPISRFLFKIYTPVINFVLKKPLLVIGVAVAIFLVSMPVFLSLGREFMPPLNEGSILYMPSTLPGISVTEAESLLQLQDKILKSFPEVETVFGKAGRADTATDPAPFSMMETTVVLKPQSGWRKKTTWYSGLKPEFLQAPFRIFWPDTISYDELIALMDAKLKIPGQINSWTLPVKGRIDMLTTGVRTPVGIKIYGDDLARIEDVGKQIEKTLMGVRGTRSVYAERTQGGYFVDINLRREALARYGLSIATVQDLLAYAVGGENITQTIEGRERFPVNIRFPREFRDDVDKLKNLPVPVSLSAGAASQSAAGAGSAMGGTMNAPAAAGPAKPTGWIPLSEIADITLASGPGMIRDENGRLAGYVFIDVSDRDIGSYVDEAKRVIKENIVLPAGYTYKFSGQYENMESVANRMILVVPLTLLLIFILIFLNTKSAMKTMIVLLAVPFSLIGVAWLLFFLQYNVSIGVWSGIIALLGLDAETGIFMLLYLDMAYERMKKNGLIKTPADIKLAIREGAVRRIRPKMMTVLTALIGLFPIMWASTFDAGADLMKRIAAPMVGGLVTSFLMELLIYPAVFFLWRSRTLRKETSLAALPGVALKDTGTE